MGAPEVPPRRPADGAHLQQSGGAPDDACPADASSGALPQLQGTASPSSTRKPPNTGPPGSMPLGATQSAGSSAEGSLPYSTPFPATAAAAALLRRSEGADNPAFPPGGSAALASSPQQSASSGPTLQLHGGHPREASSERCQAPGDPPPADLQQPSRPRSQSPQQRARPPVLVAQQHHRPHPPASPPTPQQRQQQQQQQQRTEQQQAAAAPNSPFQFALGGTPASASGSSPRSTPGIGPRGAAGRGGDAPPPPSTFGSPLGERPYATSLTSPESPPRRRLAAMPTLAYMRRGVHPSADIALYRPT